MTGHANVCYRQWATRWESLACAAAGVGDHSRKIPTRCARLHSVLSRRGKGDEERDWRGLYVRQTIVAYHVVFFGPLAQDGLTKDSYFKRRAEIYKKGVVQRRCCHTSSTLNSTNYPAQDD
eukprot:2177460-Amphidinium_carterae.1